ncbi:MULTISPECIES: hypothetical protein [Microbacterium]|jgi:hypothetical protein|nr:hypothetical protein [Microbacterium nymphoidis]
MPSKVPPTLTLSAAIDPAALTLPPTEPIDITELIRAELER